jgi:transcriptional regulator of aromatic amino acid metabolism
VDLEVLPAVFDADDKEEVLVTGLVGFALLMNRLEKRMRCRRRLEWRVNSMVNASNRMMTVVEKAQK